MQFRKFSNLGWKVSEIGIGCWAIGSEWGDVSETDAKEALYTSLDNGINFFDTADVYGNRGGSEEYLGEILRENRKKKDRVIQIN